MLLLNLLAISASCSLLQVAATPLGDVRHESSSRKREIPSSHVLHERHKPHWGSRWSKRERLSNSTVLPMRVGLKQINLDAGHDLLMEISDPASPNFGKHLTAEEVIDYFAPHRSSVDIVVEWLTGAGIPAGRISQSANKQWIQFDATVKEAETLLYTDFHIWEHAAGHRDISCEEYHIPMPVQEHVDYITPGTRLRIGGSAKKRSTATSQKRESTHVSASRPALTLLPGFPVLNSTSCGSYITADCVRAQYSIPKGTKAAPSNKLGIFEAIGDHYSKVSLDVLFSHIYPYIPNGTYPEERLIDGAVGAIEDPSEVPVDEGKESALDFQIAVPLVWPQKTVLYQADDEFWEDQLVADVPGFWNTFLDAIDGSYCNYSAYGETGDCKVAECLDPSYPDPSDGGYKGQLQCGVFEPTNVISISYTNSEIYTPDYYMKRQCNEWMKLALQGVTVVESSGDDGVGADDECIAGPDGPIFEPYFANTCPYILSVGSTELDYPAGYDPTSGKVCKLNEIATTRFKSGGGFSNVFPTASYQAKAVKEYLDNVKLPFKGYKEWYPDHDFTNLTSGVYHIGGRGYPDVSAVGDREVIYASGDWWLIGGTSQSTPIWASLLNLINEERLALGKSRLGFINPILYAHPEVFNDITVGDNIGCNESAGFTAAKGWDPLTGLGSPKYPKLFSLLVSI